MIDEKRLVRLAYLKEHMCSMGQTKLARADEARLLEEDEYAGQGKMLLPLNVVKGIKAHANNNLAEHIAECDVCFDAVRDEKEATKYAPCLTY